MKAKKVNNLREALQKQKEKTDKIKSELEFNDSQNVLKIGDLNELLKHIRHLIDEL
ncbi:hypothetical protein LCGC14_0949370 [marine sediment metagenome]|uniref:Uncharacterized protein n=1 Tax=marine sediment metagenome TaxID=412755 RepID=A0A0F9R178_9ZZZZ|nr:MAG: hypothetical protein Lokiarch_47230 [Candidatus Lokiarchaeum sp. GC14_75]